MLHILVHLMCSPVRSMCNHNTKGNQIACNISIRNQAWQVIPASLICVPSLVISVKVVLVMNIGLQTIPQMCSARSKQTMLNAGVSLQCPPTDEVAQCISA